MSERVVIVGAGQCAGVAAASLREQGYTDEIVIVGEEAHAPYQRPPLSKNFLAGQMSTDQVLLKPAPFYAERKITLQLGTRVEAIDRAAASIRLASGATIDYSVLLLATGSRPRRLDLGATALPGVHYLRSLADAEAIRREMAPGKRMVVIGGGYIGLEAAAVAVRAGVSVVVLEAAGAILGRVCSPPVAEFLAAEHREHGVDIRCGVQIEGFEGTTHIESVACSDAAVPADLLVIGVGIEPNVELAAAAGLACDDGIVVDAYTRTADPKIHAAGDCSKHPNGLLGRCLRLESVQNAVDQARAAASNICGKERVYNELPWFWSNQYDLRLQIAGLSQGHDQTLLRGSKAARSFSILYLHDGKLIAADTVNAPRDHLALRKLIAAGGGADIERLTDPAVAIA